MKTIKETRTVVAVKMFIKSLRYIMVVRKEGWKLVHVVTSFQEWAAILVAPIAHNFFSYGIFFLPVFIARCKSCFFPACLQYLSPSFFISETKSHEVLVRENLL